RPADHAGKADVIRSIEREHGGIRHVAHDGPGRAPVTELERARRNSRTAGIAVRSGQDEIASPAGLGQAGAAADIAGDRHAGERVVSPNVAAVPGPFTTHRLDQLLGKPQLPPAGLPHASFSLSAVIPLTNCTPIPLPVRAVVRSNKNWRLRLPPASPALEVPR